MMGKRDHPKLVVAGGFLLLLILTALTAPLIAPRDPLEQNHIAVADMVVDHRVAAHFQGVRVSVSRKIREVQYLALLYRFQRSARRDPPQQRQPVGIAGLHQASVIAAQ